MLRAVTLVNQDRCRYEEVLDVAEPRALNRLLQRAGVVNRSDRFGVDAFLTHQTIVSQQVLVERVKVLVLELCRI